MAMMLRVRAIRQLTADVRAFELVHPDGAALPGFTPGAHLQVRVGLPDGTTGLRAYSLVHPASDTQVYEIAVLHQPGGRGGSAWMHARVAEGDLLEVRAPANAFSLAEGARHSVLIAGGIGITPLVCMAQSLQRQGAGAALHYFARSREAMAYRDELAALAGVAVHDWIGLAPDAVQEALQDILRDPAPDRHLYVCGPAGLLDAVLATARRLGWPESQVHHERFSGAPAQEASAFEVELRQSGTRFVVPARESLLDALLARGIDAPHDCRAGVCGSCLVPVAAGTIVHHDTFLSADDRASGGLMCACVSRGQGLLVLDL